MNSKVALIWDGLEDIDFRSSGSSAGSLGAALKAAIVFALDQEAVGATAFVPLLMKSQFYPRYSKTFLNKFEHFIFSVK